MIFELEVLGDPFEIFPLDTVARKLGQLVVETEDFSAERSGLNAMSSRYRTVEEEHDVEVISCLIGSVFVLGQSAITRTVAVAKKLCDLADRPAWLPNGKAEILRTGARIHDDTGVSEMVLIDAVANYFKHHEEWPGDWSLFQARPQQRRTIQVVSELGLSPQAHDTNMRVAVRNLGFKTTEMDSLGSTIQAWRETLAEHLRSRLSEHGFRPPRGREA